MRAILIEDEADVLVVMRYLLKQHCPDLEVVGVARSAKAGQDLIKNTDFDLALVDVQLGDGSGITLLKHFEQRNFQVIFITAHHQYAVDAFKLSAIDYLLKPVDPDLLVQAVERAQQNKHREKREQQLKALLENLESKKFPKKLVVSDLESVHVIAISEILSLEAEGGYSRLFLETGQEILSTKNLKHFEQLLENASFFRSHHGHLVNLHKVIRFERRDGGYLVLEGEKNVPVSVRKRENLLKALSKL